MIVPPKNVGLAHFARNSCARRPICCSRTQGFRAEGEGVIFPLRWLTEVNEEPLAESVERLSRRSQGGTLAERRECQNELARLRGLFRQSPQLFSPLLVAELKSVADRLAQAPPEAELEGEVPPDGVR